MSLFGAGSRDELRRSYATAWRKRLDGVPLSALEALIADVIALHPEYQALVADAAAAQAFEPDPMQGRENPFLHMGLHLAVREQVAVDRPPGVRDLHRRLQAQQSDLHDAEHVLVQALADTLWEARQSGRPPDEGTYLQRARRALR
jgi:hypothetical protein